MADMTKTTADVYLPEVWSKKASITYRSNTVIVPLLDHRWEPEVGVGMGDTVRVPGFSQNNSPSNRGAGTGTFGTGAAITFDAVTETSVSLLVDRLYYKAFRLPVEMSAQVMSTYVPLLTDGIGQAISLGVDSDLASDNTNGLDSFTAIGTDNVDVTDDIVLDGETVLNNANVPLDGRVFIYSPATRGSLMKIDHYRNSLFASSGGNLDGSKGPGYQGRLYTLDCYMSNNLEAGTSGKKNWIGHREAIAYASQKEVRILKDMNVEDGLFDQYVGYLVCGFLVIKSGFGREVDGK